MALAPDLQPADQGFLAQQRRRLEDEREGLMRVLEEFASQIAALIRQQESGEPPEEGFGRGGSVSIDFERARAQHKQLSDHLAEVTAALERIDTGTYGICEQCGGPIGHERLEAVPTATRCVTCKAGLPSAAARTMTGARSKKTRP